MSTEELKKDFILLLLQDARKFADACVRDTSLCRRSEEVFDKIESVLDLARDAKDGLREIIKSIEPKIREKENEKKEYLKT